MKNSHRLSTIAVVLPAFNESRTIGSILDNLPRKVEIGKRTFNVMPIVVNDGSNDNTPEVVLKQKGIYLINHILNCGAGAATRTGLTYASQINCVAAVTMDADGQHSINDVLKVMHAVINKEGDLVIGSRLIDSTGMPWYRVLGNKGLSFVTFLLFGVFVTDSQSGMRGLNVTALDNISFYNDGFAFCSEMIWRAKQKKLKIKEVPIKAIYTSHTLTKGQSNWGAIAIIQQLLKRRFLEFIHG